MKASDIILLSDEERRKLTLVKKKRKRYKKEKRENRPREEMVAYLREHGHQSAGQLRKGRLAGDPNVYDYIKEFGSWNAAKLEAFGPPDFEPEVDAEYVAKTVIQFNLWTYRRYREARKKRPDIVPSYHEVRKRWGGFGNLVVYARKISMAATLDVYRNFKRRLKSIPTTEQCTREGIDLSAVVKFFGGKKNMDDFINKMEATGANR